MLIDDASSPKPITTNTANTALFKQCNSLEELKRIVFVAGIHKGKTFAEIMGESPGYILYLISKNRQRLKKYLDKNEGEYPENILDVVPYPRAEDFFLLNAEKILKAEIELSHKRISEYENLLKIYNETGEVNFEHI